ncbi:MAG: hypothetical protein M1540_01760 [Candidatus Bathyarchaeota archaeon]|nr:hypothetical protein [Candidatus Bathyarchaeota archaeon]
MNTLLIFKKKQKFRSNRKGVSSIIGAVFLILIVGTLASSYFFFTLSQNTLYNDAVKQTNQLEIRRNAESLQALNTTYKILVENNLTIDVKMQNIGPMDVTLINLWAHVIENPGGSGLDAANYTPVNITLKGGQTLQQEFNVTLAGLSPARSYAFSAWFITSLGNIMTLKQVNTEEIVVSQTTQGIGSLAMDFQDFRCFTVNNRQLVNYPFGSSGYVVTTGAGSPIAFKVVLTNLNYQTKADIILSADSVFFSIFPTTAQQVRGSYWYIVNVDAQGLISNSFSNITLRYNVPTAVYFASATAIKGTALFSSSSPGYSGTSPINLALIGSKDGQPFGQNVPFVSVYVS